MESHSVISPPAHCCQISRLDLSKKVKGTYCQDIPWYKKGFAIY